MTIQEYIKEYYDNEYNWFEQEVKQGWHIKRIADTINYKDYLNGKHKVLNRENSQYKGKEYVTRKIVLQTAKTILNFHSTYLLGKPVSLIGSESMVKEFNKIYRRAGLTNINYKIVDKVNKYGDCFEYIYVNEAGQIKSKLINSEDGYPIYDDEGEYIGFIEYYITDNVSHWTIFYPDRVEKWNNKGGELNKEAEFINVSGLPIHYHNANDIDNNMGRSELADILPILDEMEDLLSKMGDSIYTLSLNPMPVSTGQRIDSSIPADATGYVLNLDDGAEFKYANATMDYNSIKLYYDNLKQHLNDIAYMPSVAMGNSNVANVSEVSLKLLYQLADVKAMLNERYIKEGFNKRHDVIIKLLNKKNIVFGEDDYVDVEFTYARPVNTSEIMDNIKKQWEMGAISKKTIIEKSEYTNDVEQEMQRLSEEEDISVKADSGNSDGGSRGNV